MARVVVLGRSGTGKSYYVGYLLEQSVPSFTYAVHFDVEDEESGLSDPDYDPLYLTLYVDQTTADAISWPKAIHNHNRIRVVPTDLTSEEMREVYAQISDGLMKLCMDLNPDATAFLSCDEAHNICRQAQFDERVERLITGGRKHGVECLHISQRPQLLHTTVISQADQRICFGISDDNDLAKIDKQAGFSARTELPKLGERECIIENKNSGEWTKISTEEDADRKRPHHSGDDGLLDEQLPV